ncbi:MAG: ATP-binding cassette domain-containing protein, partial [Bdellovibrionales bacterium]|nr:ATP-binding cassette domain-containing protein [Bdellovibrionales bacterium]
SNLVKIPERYAVQAEPLVEQIAIRARAMVQLGLGYLALARSADQLSAGELQRVRLATQLASRLSGVLYVLDEPTVGLHPADTELLLAVLGSMQEAGNTVVVVEHERSVIRAANYIVEMGPGAGDTGGKLLAAAALADFEKRFDTPTARYLRGGITMWKPTSRRAPTDRMIELRGVRTHNLKIPHVTLPLGLVVAVSGVSGAGKSSLVYNTLLPELAARTGGTLKLRSGEFDSIEGAEGVDRVIWVDDRPIGRTARSTPATFAGMWTAIRELFASLPEARIRGYSASRFSFNVREGRCAHCEGLGEVRLEFALLPDFSVPCPVCHGARFDRATLDVRFRGHSIADVLELSIEEALELFSSIPTVAQVLQTMLRVGLGYLRLGQPAQTLSGGEAQRLKLAAELARNARGHTMYVLDEPTTGLHFGDKQVLARLLHDLVDAGHSVIFIEHDPELLACADWIIDIGPGAGAAGGRIIAAGSPEDIA